jgi:hypothetical protein
LAARCLAALALLSLAMVLVFGTSPGMAQSRAHVYLFRGLADVFSLGMNTLADELNNRGIASTVHSHTDWKTIADKAAENYKAGKEGPIILIGHSLGADAVMEMADYLGDKSVPVALVIPFDATQSFPAPGNVGRVVNLTQRDYAYMKPGPGFRGSLANVDLRGDPNISHTSIDKSPDLHARAIGEVRAVVGGRRMASPIPTIPGSIDARAPSHIDGRKITAPRGNGSAKFDGPTSTPEPSTKFRDDAMKTMGETKPLVDSGPQSEGRAAPATSSSTAPATSPALPKPVNAAQIPD